MYVQRYFCPREQLVHQSWLYVHVLEHVSVSAEQPLYRILEVWLVFAVDYYVFVLVSFDDALKQLDSFRACVYGADKEYVYVFLLVVYWVINAGVAGQWQEVCGLALFAEVLHVFLLEAAEQVGVVDVFLAHGSVGALHAVVHPYYHLAAVLSEVVQRLVLQYRSVVYEHQVRLVFVELLFYVLLIFLTAFLPQAFLVYCELVPPFQQALERMYRLVVSLYLDVVAQFPESVAHAYLVVEKRT